MAQRRSASLRTLSSRVSALQLQIVHTSVTITPKQCWRGATAVQARCQEMQRMANDAATSLRNEYTIQLMKLPKKVRVSKEAMMP